MTSGFDEATLEKLVLDCGSFYLPRNDSIPTATWLATLLDLCPTA